MTASKASGYFKLGTAGLSIVSPPENKTPSNGDIIGTQNPLLESEGYKSLYGMKQLAAEFIVYDATGQNIVQQSGILTPVDGNPINSWEIPSPLPMSSSYMWNHKFRSVDGEAYSESPLTAFSVPSATIVAPVVLSPVNSEITSSNNIVVQTTPFAVLGGIQTHTETTIEVATDAGFNSIDQTIVQNSGDLINVPISLTNSGTSYYLRVKHKGNVTNYSGWSDVVSITSAADFVFAPIITYPRYSAGVQESMEATSAPFAANGVAQVHVASIWEVYENADLTELVWSSGVSNTSLTSAQVINLKEASTYFLRKKDVGSVTGESDWSETVIFYTAGEFYDWSLWDGSADGLEMLSTTTTANGYGLIRLDEGKYLASIDGGLGGTNIVSMSAQVISSYGLVVEEGEVVSVTGFPNVPSINNPVVGNRGLVRVDEETAISWATQRTNVGSAYETSIYMVPITISGGTLEYGAIQSFEIDTASNLVNVAHVRLLPYSDSRVVMVWDTDGASNINIQALDITGTYTPVGTPVQVVGTPNDRFRAIRISMLGDDIAVCYRRSVGGSARQLIGIFEYDPNTDDVTLVGECLDTRLNTVDTDVRIISPGIWMSLGITGSTKLIQTGTYDKVTGEVLFKSRVDQEASANSWIALEVINEKEFAIISNGGGVSFGTVDGLVPFLNPEAGNLTPPGAGQVYGYLVVNNNSEALVSVGTTAFKILNGKVQ